MDLEIEGHSELEITYHVMLLAEAGLIHAFGFSCEDFPEWRPAYLKWQGHEFLNAARDNGRWQKAKALVKEKGGGMVFDVLKSVLVEGIKISVKDMAS